MLGMVTFSRDRCGGTLIGRRLWTRERVERMISPPIPNRGSSVEVALSSLCLHFGWHWDGNEEARFV